MYINFKIREPLSLEYSRASFSNFEFLLGGEAPPLPSSPQALPSLNHLSSSPLFFLLRYLSVSFSVFFPFSFTSSDFGGSRLSKAFSAVTALTVGVIPLIPPPPLVASAVSVSTASIYCWVYRFGLTARSRWWRRRHFGGVCVGVGMGADDWRLRRWVWAAAGRAWCLGGGWIKVGGGDLGGFRWAVISLRRGWFWCRFGLDPLFVWPVGASALAPRVGFGWEGRSLFCFRCCRGGWAVGCWGVGEMPRCLGFWTAGLCRGIGVLMVVRATAGGGGWRLVWVRLGQGGLGRWPEAKGGGLGGPRLGWSWCGPAVFGWNGIGIGLDCLWIGPAGKGKGWAGKELGLG